MNKKRLNEPRVNRDTEITALADQYHRLIGDDHHKDRDCHWSVEKSWDYGEGPRYTCLHVGYCHEPWQDGESKPFTTYAKAEAELIRGLKEAIAVVSSWEDNG